MNASIIATRLSQRFTLRSRALLAKRFDRRNFGPEMNRDTVANVQAAGFIV